MPDARTADDDGLMRHFADALLDADAPPPPGLRHPRGGDVARRLAVHRHTVRASLVAALGDTLPVLRAHLGADCFDAVAAAFVRAHPPASPVLADYGEALPDWLEGFAPLAAWPWLADLARLELARVQAWQAADAPVLDAARLTPWLARPQALAVSRPVLHPSVRLLVSPHDVAGLWRAHRDAGVGVDAASDGEGGHEATAHDRALPPAEAAAPIDLSAVDIGRGCALRIGRRADDAITVAALSPAEAVLLQALRDDHPLGEAWAIAQAAPDGDTLTLDTLLAGLLRDGALTDWIFPMDTP